VAAGGEWSSWTTGEVNQQQRPHIWYFALSACTAGGRNATQGVDFQLRLRQPGGSELSYEQMHMPAASLLVVLCLSGLLAHLANRWSRLQHGSGSSPAELQALACIVLLHWTAELSQLLHLHRYEQQGFGDSGFKATASMLSMMSQVASCTLLLTIAQGHTFVGASSLEPSVGALRRTAVPVSLLHALLVGHGVSQGSHAEKHHENEGAVGLAIVAMRLHFLIWFLICLRRLRQQCRSVGLLGFLAHFQVVGSAYFLAHPIIYGVVQVFAPYFRQPLLHVGLATLQTSISVWLAGLFSPRGIYFGVSTLCLPLLPGACRMSASGCKMS